jgi:protease I
MTSGKLQGVRVAILASDGFEELELLDPKLALNHAGAATFVIAPTKDRITGSRQGKGEKSVSVDISLESANAEDFHALLLPGGNTNARHLADNREAVEFVKAFMHAGKPVAAVGEGLEVLVRTGTLRERTVTSGILSEEDLRSAGTKFVDKDVVRDGNLMTARSIDEVPALIRDLTGVLAELREHSADMRKTA